jgi:hypothetical protein
LKKEANALDDSDHEWINTKNYQNAVYLSPILPIYFSIYLILIIMIINFNFIIDLIGAFINSIYLFQSSSLRISFIIFCHYMKFSLLS